MKDQVSHQPSMSILLDVGSSGHARDDDITMPASEFTCLSQETRAELEDSVAQYPDIENKLTRLPQFAKADEFFECLWQSLVSSGGRLTPTATGYSTDKVSYEIIIENQRGSTVFGVPMYSNRSLFHPIDPPKFQTLNGHSLGNMGMYPLPGRNSRWSWRSWQVLMINDVDEDGWIYSSFRFGSRRWRGKGGVGSLVRRRIWVRMAEIIDPECVSEESKVVDERGTTAYDDVVPKIFVVNPIPGEPPLDSPVYPSQGQSDDSAFTAVQTVESPVSSHQKLKAIYNDLSGQVLDRLKADRMIEFLRRTDDETLAYVVKDFAQNSTAQTDRTSRHIESKPWTWTGKLLLSLRFPESQTMFLKRLEEYARQVDSETRQSMLATIIQNGYQCIPI